MRSEPTPGPMACPACHVALDRLLLLPWGDGQHRLPAAPWICASCAALGIIELARGRITLTQEEQWQEVKERNPVLWQAITQVRDRIRQQEKPPHA